MKSLSKVTSKFQTSIPKDVREKLAIHAGDYVTFAIKGNAVTFRKVEKIDKNLLKLMQKNLHEWNSKEDDECFSHLKKLVKNRKS